MRILATAVSAAFVLAASFNIQTASASATDTASLKAKAMNAKLPRAERVEAIKQLYPELLSNNQEKPHKICVWDVVGRSGPIFASAKDQQARLMEFGLNVEMSAYTNEGVLSEDLQAGQCDAALFTGIRARTFNKFAGTVDAVGAIPTSEHMNLLMRVLASPQNADKMEEGNYVVMGMAPMGAVYFFVNDRSISSISKAAGKRVAVMDYDSVQTEMVLGFGASPVPTSIVNAGSMFNNRVVDVLPSPLVGYHVMELYKGIGDNGGIVNYPFTQITLQLVGRKDKFPQEVAQLIREDFYSRFQEIEEMVAKQTGDVPESVWIEIPDEDKADYQSVMQDARIKLRDRDYYDGSMLTLQRKVRCKFEPARSECTNPVE